MAESNSGIVAQLTANVGVPLWLLSALVLVLIILIFFVGVAATTKEGLSMPPEEIQKIGINASSGGSGVQQQQLDAANMGSGSNAERQRMSSVPHQFSVGDPVTGNYSDEYLRWCGVKDLNEYEGKGYAAMQNPRAWMVNTMYDGEPSIKLGQGSTRMMEGFVTPQQANMAQVGI